jgi:hypothetical protein
MLPPSSRLPGGLAADLRGRADGATLERVPTAIGLHVIDEWFTPTTSVALEYRVAPGETAGFVPDAVSGLPVAEAWLCRTSHVTATGMLSCLYCRSRTCAVCPDRTEHCDICTIAVCGRCRPRGERLCPGCTALDDVNMLRRKRMGLPLTSEVWVGVDAVGQVRVVFHQDHWTVYRLSGDSQSEIPVDFERSVRLQAKLHV